MSRPLGVEERVDFQDRGLRRALEEVLAVVEDHDVARAGQAGPNPMHVVQPPICLWPEVAESQFSSTRGGSPWA